MIHNVVKRLRFLRHETELPRLGLGEATRGKSRPRRFRFRRSVGEILRIGGLVAGVDVVGFGGPAEDRGPPVGRGGGGFPAALIRSAVGGGADAGGGKSEEICRHF